MKEPQIEHSRKGKNPLYKKNHYKGNNNFYSKEEESSSNESSDSDGEKILFLGIAEGNEHEEDLESEEEVNMGAKLLSTLDELKRYKNKYKQHKSVVATWKDKQEKEEKELENILSELRKERRENKLLNEEIKKLKEKSCKSEKPNQEGEELSKEIEEARATNINLKIQLEESKQT